MYAGGDISLFLILLRTLDIPTVIIGTITLAIPYILMIIFLIFLTDYKARKKIIDKLSAYSWVAAIGIPAVATIMLYTAPIPVIFYWTFVLLVGVAYALLKSIRIRRYPDGLMSKFSKVGSAWPKDWISTVFSVAATFLIIQSNMWLPLERISFSSKKEVGYVLQVTSEWTTLLTKNRGTVVIATKDIATREVCKVANVNTIAADLNDKPKDTISC